MDHLLFAHMKTDVFCLQIVVSGPAVSAAMAKGECKLGVEGVFRQDCTLGFAR
jgi:hypothetical protein